LPWVPQRIGDRIGDEFRIAIQSRNLPASFHASSILITLRGGVKPVWRVFCRIERPSTPAARERVYQRFKCSRSGTRVGRYGQAAEGGGGGGASCSITYPIVL
jgi:hypothetical protein